MTNKIYEILVRHREENKKTLALLIDPDKIDFKNTHHIAEVAQHFPPDFWLVGGSLLTKNALDQTIQLLRQYTCAPIILFPSNYMQIHAEADAILFLSLISGRNPEFLIGQHIIAAPFLKHTNLEILSTSYILVNCGSQTSVEYVSQTQPIPYTKMDLAVATAIAGEMLGHRLIYLEGGSGALKPVATEMIRQVRANTQSPLIVGGGIKHVFQLQKVLNAGADMAVIGTLFEENPKMWQDFYHLVRHNGVKLC